MCQTFQDNYEKFIPFFLKYPIRGGKIEDFQDWCKVAEIIKVNSHPSGLDQIRQIRANMNKGRTVLNCDISQNPLKSSRRFYSVCTNSSKEYTTPGISP